MWRSTVDKHGSGEGWRAEVGDGVKACAWFVLACKGIRNGRGHAVPQ